MVQLDVCTLVRDDDLCTSNIVKNTKTEFKLPVLSYYFCFYFFVKQQYCYYLLIVSSFPLFFFLPARLMFQSKAVD